MKHAQEAAGLTQKGLPFIFEPTASLTVVEFPLAVYGPYEKNSTVPAKIPCRHTGRLVVNYIFQSLPAVWAEIDTVWETMLRNVSKRSKVKLVYFNFDVGGATEQ